MEDYVEYARSFRKGDDWPEVVAQRGHARFWRDEVVEVVGRQREDLSSMYVEEHAIRREEYEVRGDRK